jgi:hypothetical protein
MKQVDCRDQKPLVPILSYIKQSTTFQRFF